VTAVINPLFIPLFDKEGEAAKPQGALNMEEKRWES